MKVDKQLSYTQMNVQYNESSGGHIKIPLRSITQDTNQSNTIKKEEHEVTVDSSFLQW